MIELKNVNKVYKNHEVVKDVSVKFDTGNIYIDDKELGKDMDFPKNMGVIIETPGFLPWLTGL